MTKYVVMIAPLNSRLNRWGSWKVIEGLRLVTTDKYDLRKDLTGVHIEAATESHLPFTNLEPVFKQSLPRGYVVSFWLRVLRPLEVIEAIKV